MYALFSKSLETGLVSVFMDTEWVLLKARIADEESVDEEEWNAVGAWQLIRDDYVLNDGELLWCYWDESRLNSFGAELFTGTVIFFSECKRRSQAKDEMTQKIVPRERN